MPSTNRTSTHELAGSADQASYHPGALTDWSSPEPETVQQGLDDLAAAVESHPVIDTTPLVRDPVDNTRRMRIDVGLVAAGTTRVLTIPDRDVDLASGGTFAERTHASTHESGGSDAVNHDNLTGFVANEHVDHSSVSVLAGTGLSGGGTIASDRTLNVKTALRTRTAIFFIQDPRSTDVIPILFTKDAITITKVYAVTDSATVTFNLYERTLANTFSISGESKIMTADMVADATSETTTTFTDAAIAAESSVTFKAVSTTGSPARLMVAVSYTID